MPTIETKQFDKDKVPVKRNMKQFCPRCGEWYTDKCGCGKVVDAEEFRIKD